MANGTDTGDSHGVTGHFTDHYVILLVIYFLFLALIVRFIYTSKWLQKYLPIPFTVIMLVIGLLMQVWNRNALGGSLEISMSYAVDVHPDIILFFFVPALVFESAYSINHHVFKNVFIQSFSLATIGVAINIGLVATLVFYCFGYDWSWWTALMLGAIVSATDPVAVVALLRELGVSPRLSTLIEGESLLNDGSAYVAFLVFRDQIIGGEGYRDAGEIVTYFLRLGLGGPLVGIALGLGACLCLLFINFDAISETTIILILPFAAFWVCEVECEVSGVLGVVFSGLVAGHYGKIYISSLRIAEQIHFIWEMLGWWLNAMLFAITGIILADRVIHEESVNWRDWVNILILYLWIHVTRFVSILCQLPILEYFGYNLSFGDYVVLTYGGLRGAIALALALIVEQDEFLSPEIKTHVVFLVGGVVFLTLIINGTTTRYVLQFFGMGAVNPARLQLLENSTREIKEFALSSMQTLQQSSFYKGANWATVEKNLHLEKFGLKKESNQSSEDDNFLHTRSGVGLTLLCSAGHLTSLGAFTGMLTETFMAKEERLELRKVFYQALKIRYRHFFYEDRALNASSYFALIESVDAELDIDNTYSMMGHWHALAPMFELPAYLTKFIFKIRWDYLNKVILHRWIMRGYEIGIGFIQANRELQPLLEAVRPNVGAPLLEEVHKAIELAHEAVVSLTSYAPELTTLVQTRHATFNLLKGMLHHTEEAYEEGLYEENEAAALSDFLYRRIRSLQFRPFASERSMPSDKELLSCQQLLRPLTRVFELLEFTDKKVLIDANMPIDKLKGDNCLYIVLHGRVEHKFREYAGTGKEIDELIHCKVYESTGLHSIDVTDEMSHTRSVSEGPGAVIGSLGLMANLGEWETADTLSVVECIRLGPADWEKIERDHEFAAIALWRIVASQMICHHFRRIALNIHPTGLSEAIIDAEILLGSNEKVAERLPYQILTCCLLMRGSITISDGLMAGGKEVKVNSPNIFEGKRTILSVSPDAVIMPLDEVEKHRNRLKSAATRFYSQSNVGGGARSSTISERLKARHSVGAPTGSRRARGSVPLHLHGSSTRDSIHTSIIDDEIPMQSLIKRRNSDGP